MHGVEECREPPYLFGDEVAFQIVDREGAEQTYRGRTHDFAGFRQRYDRVAPLLDDSTRRHGPVLAATADLLDAAAVWNRGTAALREDPFYFVERVQPDRQV